MLSLMSLGDVEDFHGQPLGGRDRLLVGILTPRYFDQILLLRG